VGEGATPDEARAAAPPVTLYEDRQFKIYAKCSRAMGVTRVETFIAAKQPGTVVAGGGGTYLIGDPYLGPDTPEGDDTVLEQLTSNEGDDAPVDFLFSDPVVVLGADGHAISADLALGVKGGSLPGGDGPYPAGRGCVALGTVELLVP
jgi:hypothetical protein